MKLNQSLCFIVLTVVGLFLQSTVLAHECTKGATPGCSTGLGKSSTFRSSVIDFLVIDLFSDQVPRHDVERAVQAVAAQVKKDFAPRWGMSARFKILPRGKIPKVRNNKTALVYLTDTIQNSEKFASVANHYIVLEAPNESDGEQPQFWIPNVPLVAFGTPVIILPFGDGHYGISEFIGNPIVGRPDAANALSIALSHEVLETLGDSFAGFSFSGAYQMLTPGPTQTLAFIREVCDPVQFIAYKRSNRLVSNFVTPDYFNSEVSHDTCLDFLGLVKEPMTPYKGVQLGYIIHSDGEFEQVVYVSNPSDPNTILTLTTAIIYPGCDSEF